MKKQRKVEEVVYDYEEEKQKRAAESTQKEETSNDWIRQQLAILRKGIAVDIAEIEGIEGGKNVLGLKLIMTHDINGVSGFNNVVLKITPRLLNRLLEQLKIAQNRLTQESQEDWKKD